MSFKHNLVVAMFVCVLKEGVQIYFIKLQSSCDRDYEECNKKYIIEFVDFTIIIK